MSVNEWSSIFIVLVAVSRTCVRMVSFTYRFKALTKISLIFIVLVAVSRPCIRFFSFRYHFKAVTERSLLLQFWLLSPTMYQIFLIQISFYGCG